jgi:hypothetical protein
LGLELLRSDHREDEINNEKQRDDTDNDVFHGVCLDFLATLNEEQEDPEGDDSK